MSPKEIQKVIYKPDSQSTEEFTVIVNEAEFEKWKSGDTTIPLAEVVDAFEVFHSTQGSQGLLGRPSKQQLETVFGTSKDVDVITHILKEGKAQAASAIGSKTGGTNASRGSADTRGGQRTTGI